MYNRQRRLEAKLVVSGDIKKMSCLLEVCSAFLIAQTTKMLGTEATSGFIYLFVVLRRVQQPGSYCEG